MLFSIYRKICNNIEYHQIDSGGPDADCSFRVGSVDEVTHFFLKRKKNSNNSVIIARLCPS